MTKQTVIHTSFLGGILLLAVCFRFIGVNWDQDAHLHPDERFLTMVGNAMVVPTSLAEYLDPTISQLNPSNINFSFFVYGILPLTLNKLLAILLGNDTYGQFTIQGRILSGVFDLLTLFFVYKILLLFETMYHLPKAIKYFGAFFYAIAVLPIQLSHFFGVDTFLTTFMTGSFYWILHFAYTKRPLSFLVSAIFLGLALATKVTAVVMLPLLLFFLNRNFILEGLQNIRQKKLRLLPKQLVFPFLAPVIFFLLCYMTIRIADPYLFETSNVFNLQLNTKFVANLASLKSWEGKDMWYPPGIQWINKPPVIYSVFNLAVIGVGIPYFLFVLFGFFIGYKKFNTLDYCILLLWIGGFFLYQSTQFVKALRYFIFLYPFLAMFAGIGFYFLTKHLRVYARALLLCTTGIWPLMVFSIYIHPHSRVQASEWIYNHIENNAVILSEHWDDGLPIPLPDNNAKTYQYEQLPIFDPDTPEKFQKIHTLFQKGDYYILSSNRGWGSIPTVPQKYPRMTQFYQDLFANKLGYKKIKEFTSYPSLSYLGIPLTVPDDWADETFTVYDHPKVTIFQKTHK